MSPKKKAPAPQTPTCARTGQCCLSIPISWSPREMREAWETWKYQKKGGIHVEDIDLLWPMLAGRCKGKRQGRRPDGSTYWTYIYGPCRNLDWAIEKGALMPSCAIHDNKPRMCSGFPYYEKRRETRMTDAPRDENPGTFQGCGFNTDPTNGWTVEEHGADLTPLSKGEM